MLLREGFAPQLRLQPAPEIIDAALSCATAKDRPEAGWIAPLSLRRERIERGGELSLQSSRQRFRSLATSRVVVEQNGFAKTNKNLRETLLPEDKLSGHWQEERVIQFRGEMAEAGLKAQWPFAHIGETALGRHGQEMIRMLKYRLRRAQELDRAAGCSSFHAKESQLREHAIALEHHRVDRRVEASVGEEFIFNDEAGKRIPPRGVVREQHGRNPARVRRQAVDGNAQRVEVPADVASAIPGEPTEEQRRDDRQRGRTAG